MRESRCKGSWEGRKIRSAAFLFVLSLPLCLCVFEASHDPCVAAAVGSAWVRARFRREQVTRGDKRSKSSILPPFQLISVNSLGGRTKKRGFYWQVAIKMILTPPIRFPVYPVYGFAKRTMTVRKRIFPSAPLSLFYVLRPSLG